MANRYWVGDSGYWESTAHWSTSSGGPSGVSVPTSADNAIFDGGSFSADGMTAGIWYYYTGGNPTCNNFDTSAITKNVTFQMRGGTDSAIKIYGSLYFSNKITFSISGGAGTDVDFYFLGSGGTITALAPAPSGMDFFWSFGSSGSSTGSWQLLSDLNKVFSIYLLGGQFDANDYDVNVAAVFSSNSDVQHPNDATVLMGNGNWNTGYISIESNLGVSGEGSTINVALPAGPSFGTYTYTGYIAANGQTFNNLIATSQANPGVPGWVNTGMKFSGSMSFNNISFINTQADYLRIYFGNGKTVTASSVTAQKYTTHQILFRSSTLGAQAGLSASAVSFIGVDVQDNIASGSASPFDDTSAGVDSGNNTNWLFPTFIGQAIFM